MGTIAAVTKDNWQTMLRYWGHNVGRKVILESDPPKTTSSDSWATVANQTLDSSAPTLVNQIAYMSGLQVTGQDGYFDQYTPVADVPTQKWAAPGYTSDGIHGLQLAYAAAATAGSCTLP